ncbi:hypothetical protein XELAEV_18001263mg [Xenopus laevis]|uniref:INTS4 8 helical bundle domain-containing protein n=1 Tax=Xenopus laevis TaxID=8355 RepID=A0A974BP14_XENLA|nr:hypothetical protein XELAEV_18001263mg [Xenopus laevis]
MQIKIQFGIRPKGLGIVTFLLISYLLFFPSDLQRIGELQSDLAGMADFSATYLRCHLLLTKVGLGDFDWPQCLTR